MEVDLSQWGLVTPTHRFPCWRNRLCLLPLQLTCGPVGFACSTAEMIIRFPLVTYRILGGGSTLYCDFLAELAGLIRGTGSWSRRAGGALKY